MNSLGLPTKCFAIPDDVKLSADQPPKLKQMKIDPIEKSPTVIVHQHQPIKLSDSSTNRNFLMEDLLMSQTKQKTNIENDSSPSSDGLCSSLLVPTASTTTAQKYSSDLSMQSKSELKQLPYDSTSPTQCLGPCRLVLTDPNVFFTDEIVSVYCVENCFSFFPISALAKNSSISNYECPKCSSDIVNLVFFFKMNFLYGKNYSRAVEVWCYGENAQRVLKKCTKKNISVEDYLSNPDDRKLVTDTLKMFINNKTKVIIVLNVLPMNETTNVLVSINTKYVVTIDW